MRVRSLCISAALCVLSAATVVAQTDARPLEFGFKAGIPFSTLSVDDPEGIDLGSRTGIGGGGFLHIPLGSVGLQFELLYVQKGSKASGSDLEPAEATIKLDYLEVPVLLTLPFMSGPSVSPYLFGGPAFAYEVGCNIAAEAQGIEVEVDCEGTDPDVDLELDRKKFDLGLAVGGGLQLPVGSGALLLEGRYTFGLLDISDGDTDNSIKNRAATAMIGFSFPLNR